MIQNACFAQSFFSCARPVGGKLRLFAPYMRLCHNLIFINKQDHY